MLTKGTALVPTGVVLPLMVEAAIVAGGGVRQLRDHNAHRFMKRCGK